MPTINFLVEKGIVEGYDQNYIQCRNDVQVNLVLQRKNEFDKALVGYPLLSLYIYKQQVANFYNKPEIFDRVLRFDPAITVAYIIPVQ